MGRLYNRQAQESKRQRLRREAPPAEAMLWRQMRDRRLGGFKFRRQYGIERYVADFCCPECRLVDELDGPSHEGDDAAEYDLNRRNYFESLSFIVVRFTNEQVYQQMPAVLENLLRLCEVRKDR
jgi:very-short-patch-repair endonuclease